MGPGSVEDSAVTPSNTVTRKTFVEPEGEADTPSGSRSPNRQSVKGFGSETDSEEEDDDVPIPAKKPKKGGRTLVARVGKKNGKQTGAILFMDAFGELQKQAQIRQQEHERKIQQEAMSIQQKMEQDRIEFEAQLSTTLQQQSSHCQANLCSRTSFFKHSCSRHFSKRTVTL